MFPSSTESHLPSTLRRHNAALVLHALQSKGTVIKDRLSFMRFVGLELCDPVPDAKTIWLYRETLARAWAFEGLFERFDTLRNEGWLAMGWIVDATVIAARRPRLTKAEKDTIRGGGTPGPRKKARTAQIDRDGRWTIKRGRKRDAPPDQTERRVVPEIAMPMFGCKNHVGTMSASPRIWLRQTLRRDPCRRP